MCERESKNAVGTYCGSKVSYAMEQQKIGCRARSVLTPCLPFVEVTHISILVSDLLMLFDLSLGFDKIC